MEIVDCQVHFNRFGRDWATADADTTIDIGLAAMDAAGVHAVLIDECAGLDIVNGPDPNDTVLPNGAVRRACPVAERAQALHPERFAYVARIDWRDPEVADQIADVRRKPGRVCMRTTPVIKSNDRAAFLGGGYGAYFGAAQKHEVPVCIFVGGELELLPPVLEKFPDLQLVVDHCGFPTPGTAGSNGMAQLERLVALARYPNLALKWDKAPARISRQPYPYRDVEPYVRRVVDAFGPRRVMWGTDITQARGKYSWAQDLHYLLDSGVLDDSEKEWVFGRALRGVMRWPKV